MYSATTNITKNITPFNRAVYQHPVTDKDVIGFNSKNLRKEIGLKRDDFSRKTGIEKGLNMPGSSIIINVCKEFQVSADTLLGLTSQASMASTARDN